MNLKRYIQLVALLALPMLILIVDSLEGQYIGTKRPWTGQQTADSLAKKADTTVTNQLQVEIDSTQDSLNTKMPKSGFLKEGANITITEHGTPPDSLTIASTGGGGGSNWNPADSTLSLNLLGNFNRSVVDIACYTNEYGDWAVQVGDDVRVDSTNYKTDVFAVKINGDAVNEGGYVDWSGTRDFTHFTDGDTSVMADHINFTIFLGAGEQTKLHANGIQILFSCDAYSTETNVYYYNVTKASLSDGWNYIKVAKSAITSSGSPNWNAIDWMKFTFPGAPSSSCTFTVDNIQLVRNYGGEPNPFQSEGPDGTWTADWTEEGNGNIWIVEESDKVGMISGDANLSSLQSVRSFSDYNASGQLTISSASAAYLWRPESGQAQGGSYLYNNLLILHRIRDGINPRPVG